jgi:hypothetical protein
VLAIVDRIRPAPDAAFANELILADALTRRACLKLQLFELGIPRLP